MFDPIDFCIAKSAIPKLIAPGEPLLLITIFRYSASIAEKEHCMVKSINALNRLFGMITVMGLMNAIIPRSTIHPIRSPKTTYTELETTISGARFANVSAAVSVI